MQPPRKPAVAFIFITLVLDVIGVGLIVPILPTLVKELHGGTEPDAAFTVGLLLALYSAMQFIFAPLLGSLSDRFGRRPIILISLLGAGLDYFLLAWAPTLLWFFVGRIVAGITAANFSAASAYIADVSPPEKRAANFGMIGAAFGIGFIIGPAVGGALGEFGLRVPFIAAGILTLINTAYGFFVLPESLPPGNRRNFSWKKANPIASLCDLARFPSLVGLAWPYFLINIAHQVFPATWVLYTSLRYGWNSTATGLSLGFVGVMAMIVQGGLSRKIIPRLGEARTAYYALVVAAIAFALYGLAPVGWLIFVIIVFGSFGGLATPAIQGLVSKPVAPDEHGLVQGILTSLAGLSGVFGPLVASGLFKRFSGEHAILPVPGMAFFFSSALIVLAIFLARNTKK